MTRAIFKLSPKRTLHGIPTAVLLISSKQERESLFQKVDAALSLIREHAPVRFAQVKRDVESILVCGDPSTLAHYNSDLHMCELSFYSIISDTYRVEDLASSIVHEAQHGRLLRLGFGYEESLRGRIERLCYRAERAFAARVPNGSALVAHASAGMAMDPGHFSDTARSEAQAVAFERLDGPRWFMSLLSAALRRRARRVRRNADPESGRPTTG